jgi:hypothetical protein
MPGREVRLVDVAPFNGPVTLELLNVSISNAQANPTQILGSELADNLFVRVLN